MDNEVRLRMHGVSSVLSPSDSYALVLQEVGGKGRMLGIIIGPLEMASIKMAEIHFHGPRPFTHDILLDIARQGGLKLLKAVIYKVERGVYSAYLYIERTDGSEYKVDARSTDALVLSLRGGFPFYVYEEVLEREQLRNLSPDKGTYGMTPNTVGMEALKIALNDSVRREDYERASVLRDEIHRREEAQATEKEDMDEWEQYEHFNQKKENKNNL